MEPTRRQPAATLLRRVFWIPAACLVGVEVYARSFDGWGAWATGPLFLLPLFLSVAISAAGARDVFSELRSGGTRRSTLLFTAVAVAPTAWLMMRRHFV